MTRQELIAQEIAELKGSIKTGQLISVSLRTTPFRGTSGTYLGIKNGVLQLRAKDGLHSYNLTTGGWYVRYA